MFSCTLAETLMQENNYDCGVYVLANAEYFLRRPVSKTLGEEVLAVCALFFFFFLIVSLVCVLSDSTVF
jgi:hypothetical protein